MGYYVIKDIYEPYTLQEEQTTHGNVRKSGKMFFKPEYLSIMKAEKWHWKQHGINKMIIISTLTLVHPYLEV